MINVESPWNSMAPSSQRRVNSQINHDIFWITDVNGNYGFCIRARKIPFVSNKIRLKGISILKRYNEEYVELFLVLNDKKDWQIFNVLCKDLIEVAKLYDNDERMINATEIRLKRWQQLLKHERNKEFPLEKQMGLFSELLCLKDTIAPKVGIKRAIKSWVGPDYDKQDFLLDNSIIEVKSYKTTKGDIINISSKEQLFSEKDPFYLLTYALTFSEQGDTVEDIVNSIKQVLTAEFDYDILDIFEIKLMDYGFIPEIIVEPLQNFKVDKTRAFYISDEFPRISPQNIMKQIISVKYAIDLSDCAEFEINIDSLII